MSTRSLIGYLNNEGYKIAYIHSDGYPEFRGSYLMEHYCNGSDLESIMELVERGDRSTIYYPNDKKYGLPEEYRKYEREYPYQDQYWSQMNIQSFEELQEAISDSDLEFVYIYEFGTNRWTLYIVKWGKNLTNNTLSEKYDLTSYMVALNIKKAGEAA